MIAIIHIDKNEVPQDIELAKKVNVCSQKMLVALFNALGKTPQHPPEVYMEQFARAHEKCKVRMQEQYADFEDQMSEGTPNFMLMTCKEEDNGIEFISGRTESVRRGAAAMKHQYDDLEEYGIIADQLWDKKWRTYLVHNVATITQKT